MSNDVADIGDNAGALSGGTVVLQDDEHLGSKSIIASIMTMVESHLAPLNNRRRETCPASDYVIGCNAAAPMLFQG